MADPGPFNLKEAPHPILLPAASRVEALNSALPPVPMHILQLISLVSDMSVLHTLHLLVRITGQDCWGHQHIQESESQVYSLITA